MDASPPVNDSSTRDMNSWPVYVNSSPLENWSWPQDFNSSLLKIASQPLEFTSLPTELKSSPQKKKIVAAGRQFVAAGNWFVGITSGLTWDYRGVTFRITSSFRKDSCGKSLEVLEDCSRVTMGLPGIYVSIKQIIFTRGLHASSEKLGCSTKRKTYQKQWIPAECEIKSN